MKWISTQCVCVSVLLCALAVAPLSDGAIIRMENAANGSSEMTLAPGESGVMNIVLEVLPIDSLRAAFVGAFLDDNSDCVKVTGVACSEILDSYCDPSWQEDDYPIEISEDLEVEYGLVWGVLIEVAALGPGTYVLNSLELTHSGPEVETDILVTFELGARQPLAFDFDGVAFTIAPPGFPANLPDWLYVGDANSNNPPFIIHKVLESPACDGDANGDGVVDPLDSGYVLARFGCPVGTGDPGCDAADQNGDGDVDPLDSGYVLARFGECP